MNQVPARGDIWWCELPDIARRPVVVLTRDATIPRLGRVLVAPCTTTIRGLESEVLLEPGDDPVPKLCVANLDAVESVPLGMLTDRLGKLSSDRMRSMCAALGVATGCDT